MAVKTLKIGVFVYPPYVNDCNVTVVYDSKFSCENPGIGIELTQEVCRWLNLRCNFYFVKDAVFGSKTENESWTGMLGAIYAGKFDTSFPQYTPNPQRLADFAMTVPFINPEQSFLIRNPAEIEGNTNSDYMSILLPFNWLINVTFILAMLLVGSLLTWYELPPGISFCALLRYGLSNLRVKYCYIFILYKFTKKFYFVICSVEILQKAKRFWFILVDKHVGYSRNGD